MIMFSFAGLERIGITAAEASDPQRTIPRAVNQVIYRILIFYIGALAVLLCLYPWNQVVLSAALSVYNSGVYCNSRMLYGLAEQGKAPRVLSAVNRRGVPVAALAVSPAATLLCVLLNYVLPGKALGLLMSFVVAALLINWALISLSHLRFRAVKKIQGKTTAFQSPWFPYSNYLCLAFLACILLLMLLTPGIRVSVLTIPVWLVLLRAGYLIKQQGAVPTAEATPS